MYKYKYIGGDKVKKIAVYNNKGGVGKSTIAVNLAAGLARLDYEVLLIDLDDQNDCSLMLGVDLKKEQKTFFDLIDYRHPEKLENCVRQVSDNLFLLQNSRMADIEADFFRTSGEIILEDALEAAEYDYIIFDTAPTSSSRVNESIIRYVENIIVPVQLEAPSVRGVAGIYDYLDVLREDSSKIKLIIPNMYDQRTNDGKENLELLKEIFREDMITSPINRRIKIAEAGKAGQTIFDYAPDVGEQFYPIIQKVVKDID